MTLALGLLGIIAAGFVFLGPVLTTESHEPLWVLLTVLVCSAAMSGALGAAVGMACDGAYRLIRRPQ